MESSEVLPVSESTPTFDADTNPEFTIAHWAVFAPGGSGLYETVRELIKYERRMGIQAGIVDVDSIKGGREDLGITSQSHDWAYKIADVHMVHTAESMYISRSIRPKIFMIHGTPEACVWGEIDHPEGQNMSSSIERINSFDASIVLSKRHYYFYSRFDRHNRMHYVPKGIDLESWTPKGTRIDLEGEPKILYSEVWRTIKEPFVTMFGVWEYFKRNPKVMFYPIGCMNQSINMWRRIVMAGEFYLFEGPTLIREGVHMPEHWYRGVDMVISPIISGEPSRVQKEAMACGTPVITWDTNPWGDNWSARKARAFDPVDMADKIQDLWTEIMADPEGVRQRARQAAEEHYNMEIMAKGVVDVCREVLERRRVL